MGSPSSTRPWGRSSESTGSSSMLRGAVIGFGNVAIHGHLPGWLGRPDVRIVAAADARPGQRAECDARLPGARWYDSPDDLLAGEPLDFVDICTPPSSHAPIIWSALGRGLHVLCEKPLVSSHGDLARVTAAAGGGVLTDHGWHVFYVVPAWVGARPRSVGARLETRRHTDFAVEDTASVRLVFDDATADILLTWAAEERRNRVEIHGTEGRIEIQQD